MSTSRSSTSPNRGGKQNPALLLFSKWKQNIAKIRMILETGIEYRIYQRLRVFNKQHAQSFESENKLPDDYFHTMLNSASFAILLRWKQDNVRVPVEQMEALNEELNISNLFEKLGRIMSDFGIKKES